MSEQTKKFLLGIYLAGSIATLFFQIGVRSQECAGARNCAISYGKAVVWSVIWPASWVAYLKGRFVPAQSASDTFPDRGSLPKGA
jgi:hypothetical protein